jgi:hypothetical protein
MDAQTRTNELRELVKASRGIRLTELAEITVATEERGGQLVGVTAVDPDGNWCGTGRLRFPWPPKHGSVGSLIDSLLKMGIGGHIIINGTPVPEEILINIARGSGAQ